MAACRGRGLRVDRPRWTRGRRPRPLKRIFAAFGLVRQWLAFVIGPARAGRPWPVSTHAPGRQPHRRPVRPRPRRCRWRGFALSFRRGLALVLFRRTAAPRSVGKGLAVVVLRDNAEALAAAHVVGTQQAQRPSNAGEPWARSTSIMPPCADLASIQDAGARYLIALHWDGNETASDGVIWRASGRPEILRGVVGSPFLLPRQAHRGGRDTEAKGGAEAPVSWAARPSSMPPTPAIHGFCHPGHRPAATIEGTCRGPVLTRSKERAND